jgi:hypothetical protein
MRYEFWIPRWAGVEKDLEAGPQSTTVQVVEIRGQRPDSFAF